MIKQPVKLAGLISIITLMLMFTTGAKSEVLEIKNSLVIPEYHFEDVTQKTVSYLPPTERKIETYTITAYCSCEKCCGEWAKNRPDGIVYGAYGVELTPGYSVAAPLPYGTKLKIDGKIYEVQDTTASWIVDKYAGRIVDIYMGDDYQAALEFGKQVREVEIVD